ncbi:MAG: hypothetical protein ABIR92_09790 [Gemmatimonadaceae bacterium]
MDGILVAALGHGWLRDQAFGLKVVDALRRRSLPHDVELADWSFGSITAFQKLELGRYRRAIFVSGTQRDGRAPGTLARWSPPVDLPDGEEIHGRIGDCVMGAVSVDNLLIIAKFYGALPGDVVLVEAEPVDDTWGSDLSPALAGLLEPAVDLVFAEIVRPDAGATYPTVSSAGSTPNGPHPVG